MLQHLPPLRLTGADILRDGAMQRRSLSLAHGRIARGPFPEIDLSGYLILPGIVDLHLCAGDRTGPHGIAGIDRDCAAAGVTTALVGVEWGWQSARHAPDAAERMLAALEDARGRLLTDLRSAITAEQHLVGAGPRLVEAAARHRPGFVVFADRLAALQDMRRIRPDAFADHARAIGTTAAALALAADAVAARTREVPRHLCHLADAFDALGLQYGSRGDPDGETRERHSMIGARTAFFPETRQAAAAARAMMSPVVLRAPDLLPGRGPAADLVAAGLADALASDSARPVAAEAAWAMVDAGLLPLPRAWAMVSERPAEILRLADRGRLDPGRRADIAIVHAGSREVQATICAGRLTHLSGGAAARFHAATQLRVAAE